MIRNNTAGSPGGGLAGCNTSRTEIYLNDGGVFYQNTGLGRKDDILLSDSNGATAISAPYSFVSEYMLGGDPYFWKHVGSGEDYGVNYLHDDDMVKHMYTDAADGSDSITKALEKATVFIENNNSTERGGGIGSNGDVILGTDDPDTTEISVTKEWDDAGYDGRRPDKVYVWLFRDGKKVSCAEIEKAADGTWPAVSFTKLATGHEYTVSEETTGMPAIYTSEVLPEDANQPSYTVTNHINCGRLCIHKAVEGASDASGTFRFKVHLEKDGTALNGTYPVRSSDGTESTAEFTDGTAEVEVADGGCLFIDDIPQGASATVTELTTEGYVVYAGDSEDPDSMVSECSGSIGAKLTEDLYFRNVYSHGNQLTLTKQTVTGMDTPYPVSRTFWFALYDDSGYTNRVSDIKEMRFDDASSASVTFDGLLNNKTYYIAELDSEGNVINEGTHYMADGSSFTVSGGFPHLVGQEGNAETIKNVIVPKAVEGYLGIPVTKALTGRAADAKKDIYTFTLTGLDGAPVPDKTSAVLTLPDAAESTFEGMFGTIPFSEAGTFVYEIREQTGGIGGITYDETVYRITIQVESFDTIDNDTVLIPNVITMQSGKNGMFTELEGGHTAAFTNTYHAASVEYAPVVTKMVDGDVPEDNQKNFTFTMEPSERYGSVAMPEDLTCTVNGHGTGTFKAMTFTEPGTYSFVITENGGEDAGYSYDSTEYTLTLVIEDDLDGSLIVKSASYQAGGTNSDDAAAFTNTYTTTPAEYALSVTKKISGSQTPEDKVFTFRLECQSGDANGYKIANDTVTISGEGTADFEKITFTKAGIYVFEISEMSGREPGYSYDPAVHTVTVNVADHESILNVDSVVYENNGNTEETATFTNEYAVEDTKYAIPVVKLLAGDVPPVDREFQFVLTGEEKTGYVIPDPSLSIKGSGAGTFSPVRFTEAGTYKFTVSEKAEHDKGYTYDDRVYTVTIVVADRSGSLEVDSAVYSVDGSETDTIDFCNTYKTTPVSYQPKVRKVVEGTQPHPNTEFRFALTAEENDGLKMPELATAVVSGQGSANFEDITFTKAGTYSFEIKEIADDLPGWVYSDAVWTLNVQVTDEDSILVIHDASYQSNGQISDAAEFTNTHLTGSLTVTKELYHADCPVYAEEQVFYTALYSDKECRNRVSDVKELKYEDSASASVTFDGLGIGVPYYIGECDGNGNVLTSGELSDGTYFQPVFNDGNEVILKHDNEKMEKKFSNDFMHVPQHYYYTGNITVTKKLQDSNGNPKDSYKTFYIGFFADKEHTVLSDAVEPKILVLPMNGNSSASADVYTKAPDEDGLTLFPAEVDVAGNVVQDVEGFDYDVTIDSDTTVLTMEENHVSLAVTNMEKPAEAEPQGSNTIDSGTGEKEPASNVETGDNTNILLWGLMQIYAAAIFFSIMFYSIRKRRARKD